MTIAEIKEKLSQERGFGSRYPARIIFVENLDDYSALEHQLKGICDVTINVADFCRAPDTVPQFDQIKNKLKECEGQQVLLLSVGEYLRLCTKRELNLTVASSEHFGKRSNRKRPRPELSFPFSIVEISLTGLSEQLMSAKKIMSGRSILRHRLKTILYLYIPPNSRMPLIRMQII